MCNSAQGRRIKLSSPSLRPRLYLNPGDKGFVGGAPTAKCGSGDADDLERTVQQEDGERQVRF